MYFNHMRTKNIILAFSLVAIFFSASIAGFAENHWSGVTIDGYKINFKGLYRVAETISQTNTDFHSTISPADQVVKIGSETAGLSVRLNDGFGNPVSGHALRLISSLSNEKISSIPVSGTTDQNGQLSFKIFPGSEGVAIYSVYDVTSDVLLPEKAKVVYFSESDSILSYASYKSSNNQFDISALGSPSGPIDHFKFDDVPVKIGVGENISLKLTALDSKEQVVSGYLGKIRFFIDGDNAGNVDLPDDYTFTLQDQGIHTFSLAFSFKQPGSYKLKIADLQNLAVTDELSVDVVAGGTQPSVSGSSSVTITSPTTGMSGNNIQVISGKAPAGAKIKILDNNVEIASVIADVTGNFSFTTGLLDDGEHKIYAAQVNDIGTILNVSPTVTLQIDTASAEVSQIVLEPAGAVDPATLITVKLFTGENLSKAQVVVSGNVYDLTKTNKGYYQGTFSAPIEFGEYKLSFVLVDELGNEAKIKDETVLKVGKISAPGKKDPVSVASNISNLLATSGDHKVTLTWTDSASLGSPVKNYRVYYGLSPNQLTEVIDTFTNSTTWYIPNLKNSTEYYFAVVAVDMKGDSGQNFGTIVSSIPNPIVTNQPAPKVKNGSEGKEALDEMKKDVSESGPEILWLIIISALAGVFYVQFAGKGKLC